jgi:hypothetical protein
LAGLVQVVSLLEVAAFVTTPGTAALASLLYTLSQL